MSVPRGVRIDRAETPPERMLNTETCLPAVAFKAKGGHLTPEPPPAEPLNLEPLNLCSVHFLKLEST